MLPLVVSKMGCYKLTYYPKETFVRGGKASCEKNVAWVWLSVDPMHSHRSWLTPYNYCQNNPVNLIDPTGMIDMDPDPNGVPEGNPNHGMAQFPEGGLEGPPQKIDLPTKPTPDVVPGMEVPEMRMPADISLDLPEDNHYIGAPSKIFEWIGKSPIQISKAIKDIPKLAKSVPQALKTTRNYYNTVIKNSSFKDWFRTGETVVSNQVAKGPGAPGATTTWGIKGGGKVGGKGADMGFHYHIHKYNWYKPNTWFRKTDILKK